MEKIKYLFFRDAPAHERTHATPAAKALGVNALNEFESEKSKGKNLQDVERGDILDKEVKDMIKYREEHPNGQHPELWGNSKHNTIMTKFIDTEGYVAEEIVSSETPQDIDRNEYYDSFERVGADNPDGDIPSDSYDSPPEASTSVPPHILNLSDVSASDNEQDLPNQEAPLYRLGPVSADLRSNPEALTSSDIESTDNITSLANQVPSSSHKRKRESDDSEDSQGPSTRRITENIVEQAVSKDTDDMVEETISSIYDLAGDD